jgi:hypothetical protein
VPGPAADLIERAVSESRLATPVGAGRLVAIGWATVELDRAATELAPEFGWSPADFDPAPDSEALGARCRVGRATLPGGEALLLLEPFTEGRLVATLARFDEGPRVAWYMAVTGEGDGHGGSTRPGPFGPERLLPGGPPHGPDRFLIVPEPGTIRA